MTQIEKLYQSIQNLKELGVKLPEQLIDETNRVEEEIIRNEIIPTLADAISPVINQIQREILLIVEYVPDEPLQVKMTKKRSFTIPAELDLTDKIQKEYVERETFTISPHNKTSKTNLTVKFPDGKTITNKFAYETLMETIQIVGPKKVEELGLTFCGVPLVSNKRDDFYKQHNLRDDILIMTHSSTKTKKEQIEEISKRLKLNLKVKIG